MNRQSKLPSTNYLYEIASASEEIQDKLIDDLENDTFDKQDVNRLELRVGHMDDSDFKRRMQDIIKLLRDRLKYNYLKINIPSISDLQCFILASKQMQLNFMDQMYIQTYDPLDINKLEIRVDLIKDSDLKERLQSCIKLRKKQLSQQWSCYKTISSTMRKRDNKTNESKGPTHNITNESKGFQNNSKSANLQSKKQKQVSLRLGLFSRLVEYLPTTCKLPSFLYRRKDRQKKELSPEQFIQQQEQSLLAQDSEQARERLDTADKVKGE